MLALKPVPYIPADGALSAGASAPPTALWGGREQLRFEHEGQRPLHRALSLEQRQDVLKRSPGHQPLACHLDELVPYAHPCQRGRMGAVCLHRGNDHPTTAVLHPKSQRAWCAELHPHRRRDGVHRAQWPRSRLTGARTSRNSAAAALPRCHGRLTPSGAPSQNRAGMGWPERTSAGWFPRVLVTG